MKHKTEKLDKAHRHEGNTRALSSCLSSGFTLTEILVVIVIIVLMLAMAMPVFRTLTGSRSEESASNQIAGMLSRARSEAIGIQQYVGVAFFNDSTGRAQMAIVQRERDLGFKTWLIGNSYTKGDYVARSVGPPLTPIITYWVAQNDVPAGTAINNTGYWQQCDFNAIDKTSDSDLEPLPEGVSVKLINDWGTASTAQGSGTQVTDGYLSSGVIMFDSSGRLSSQAYSLAAYGVIGNTMKMNSLAANPNNYPIWKNNNPVPLANSERQLPSALYASNVLPYSQFGLVLFDREAYQSQNFTVSDPTYTTQNYTTSSYSAGTPSEKQAETWLDTNATPLLINRFNGTLVKGE